MPGAVDGGIDIDRERPPPNLGVWVDTVCERIDTGVVDQDVDAASGGRYGRESGRNRVAVGELDDEVVYGCARLAIKAEHTCLRLAKAGNNVATHPARTTRDDRNTPVEAEEISCTHSSRDTQWDLIQMRSTSGVP